MDQRMQARHRLERDLRSALHNGEFELYYQPQLNLERGEITGFEALMRWHHPERGLVGPADFIPLAEETGLIVPIGEWVLRQACLDAAKWPKGIKVAVNLSAAQFRFGNVRQAVISALGGLASAAAVARAGGHRVGAAAGQRRAWRETLDKLREIGVGIALDDFGTGYSSLSYLSRFHFDKIKIDQDLHQGAGREVGQLARDRALGRRHRREPRHRHHGGRRRDAGGVRARAPGRLHRGAGLFHQPAAPGGRGSRYTGRQQAVPGGACPPGWLTQAQRESGE